MPRKGDTRVSPAPKNSKRRKKGGLGRLLWRGGLLLLVLIVGVVVAAPWIASAVAPGMIEDSLNPRLKGSINVTGVSVRWLRAGTPVQTASVEVFDEHQNKIATLTLQSQVGIFDVLGGLGDLGEFVVAGHADVVRFPDGTTNVGRVFAPMLQGGGASQPAPSQSGQPPRLPEHLRVVLRIASLTGTYTDQSLPEPLRVSLDKLAARVVVATGQPIELTLDAEVGTAMGAAAASEPGRRAPPTHSGPPGTLSIQGTVDKVTQSDGTLTIDQAVADITVAARDLPLAVADSLGGLDGVLTRAMGERLRLDIVVNGSAQAGTARLAVATDGGASAGGTLQVADNVVTTTQPLVLTFDTARAAAADPAIQQALTGGDAAKITTIPTLTVTLADLRVPLPAPGASPATQAATTPAPRRAGPVRPGEGSATGATGSAGGPALDLRGASMTLTAALGEMGGTVVVPGQQEARSFRMAPMNVVLATRDLAEGMRLSAASDASIDAQPAGTLRIDLAATDLLDEAGGIRGGLPAVAGAVVLNDFTMAIVQPLLDAMAPGLDLRLADAIGPTLNFRVTAQSGSSGGAPLAPGAIPPTTLGLAVDSANVTAGGNVRIASDAVRTLDDQGVWLRIASIVPIASPLLKDAGATLASGGEVTVRVQDVMFAEPMAQTPPLDRARARVTFGITETRGDLTMGAAPAPYRIDPGTLSLTVDGARDSIALGGTLNALVQGGGRITTTFDTTLSGLLGQLTGKSQAATSSGQGVQITASDVGRWLAAVLPPGTPVNLGTGGQITVALSGLAIAAPPATPAGNAAKAPIAPDIAQRLTMSLDVTGAGLRFAPVLQAALPGEAAPAPEMIEMGKLALSARLAPGSAPSMTLDSAFTTAGQQFTAAGNLALAAPLSQVTTMREMVPRGRLALTDIPVELLQLVPLDIKGSDGQSVNVTALVSEAIGRKWELVLGLLPGGRGSPADNTTVAVRLTGARNFRVEGGGTLNSEGFVASDSTLRATLTPRLVQMALNNFASTLEDKPRLTENATVTATLAGFTLPLDESLAPRPGITVPLRATVETGLTVDNLVLAKDGNQQSINAGPVALQGVRVVATMPLAPGAPPAGATGTGTPPGATSAASSAASPPMTVEFALTAKRPGRDAPLLGLTGNASMTGPSINATAALADLDLAWLDASLAQPGMISGALGPTARADVTFNGDPAATAGATLKLTAANLTMPEPARVALSPTGISLGAPLRATFNATPEWATRYIFGQSDPATQSLRVNKAIPFTLTVASLNITRGQGRGPLVPGEWGVDASITAPELGVVLKTGQELRYVSPQVVVRTARQDPRKINASLTMTEARQVASATTPATPAGTSGTPGSNAAAPTTGTPSGAGATGSQPSQPAPPVENVLRASIANLMDDSGQINLAGATAEATGRIPGFPTALIDAIANQKGLLVELLGPAITLDLKARNVPLAFAASPATPAAGAPNATPPSGGSSGNAGAAAAPPVPDSVRNLRGRVEADLRSERATARLAGDINNMILTTTEPLTINLSEITRAFSEHVASGMPLVSTFEKPRTLRPATVRGEGISLPMDGNLANLNGRFSVDPGEMQFTSSNILASLLKAAGGQSSGVAGRRLQPFSFTINSGVINYEKFTLPLGEFEISTRGSVDLTNNTMDLLVYLPVGAVADDALGMFNVGLGTTLAQIAPGFDGSLPFRVRGPIATAKPQPAIDVFVKEFGSQLINPGNLLQRFLPGAGGDSGGNSGGGRGLPFFRRPGGGG